MLNPEAIKERVRQMNVDLVQLGHAEVEDSEVTCADCQHNDWCEYAWDLYNTDGDCLEDK